MARAAERHEASFSPGYRRWLLTLLVLVYASSFLDRVIVSTLAEPIKRDMGLSDLQVGLLGGLSFALFYTLLGIPIARLAERFSRVTIISVCIALWSAMTMLCGTASSYVLLLLYRVGVGVGESGCSPPSHSLIADHYPAHQRASALAIFSLGIPIGAVLGGIGGGWLAQNFDWRIAFLVVGAPGLILALLTLTTLREPPRGHSEQGGTTQAETPPFGAALKTLFGKPAFIHVALGCALTGFANFGINGFMPPYLTRAYGMSFGEAGAAFGLISGVASAIGIVLGGYAASFGARRDARWYIWVPGFATLIATPFYIAAFLQARWEVAAPMLLFSSISMYLWTAPTWAVVQNMVEPRMRATAAAIILFIANIVGQGLGPTFIGFISDIYARRAFTMGSFANMCPGGIAGGDSPRELVVACLSASANGIRYAILTVMVFFLWSAFHYLRAGRTLKQDLASAELSSA